MKTYSKHKMKTISINWSTEDILCQAGIMEVDLSESEADQILDEIFNYHDANLGVNWDVIASYIEVFISKDRD